MNPFAELRTHIDAFVGRPLAKAEPPMSSRPHLRLEWVTDKNGHRVRRYLRTADKKVGERVETAERVSDMDSARAYWQKHFVDGGEKSIKGVHGTKPFTIHVAFQGNHAYTDDALKLKDDGRRVFDPERARHMHYIWLVLSHPRHVGPSKLYPGKRQFDKEIEVDGLYGRVVLAPNPDAEDIKTGTVTHWTFVTWHMPTQASFHEAGRIASNNPTKPTSPMRKADDYSSALSLLLGHRREMSESDPGETGRLQGFPNASTPFDVPTCRNHQVKQATDSRFSMAQQASGIKPAPDYGSLTKSFLTQAEVRAAARSAVYRFPHEPTPAQTRAGNYPKRKVAWRGLTLSIENEAGTVRRGVDRDGHAWETRMVFPYGYIRGSLGSDGDHVDCYLGPDESASMVYVIHQRKAGAWGRYDEDKVMLQFSSQEEAERAYLLHYDDPRFLGPVSAMPVDEFKQKVLAADGRMVKVEPDYGQAMLKGGRGPNNRRAGDVSGTHIKVLTRKDGHVQAYHVSNDDGSVQPASDHVGDQLKVQLRRADEAIARYGYLPSPKTGMSGTPIKSKLNRRQWAQVRTLSFKRWFGNWQFDQNARVAVVAAGKLPDGVDPSKAGSVRDWLLASEDFAGPAVNKDTGASVEFPRSTLRASLKRRGAEHRQAYTVLRELIGSARFFAFEESDRDTLAGQDIYYGAMEVGGKLFSVRIKADVRHDRSTAYKDHKPIEIETISDIEVTPAVSQGGQNLALGHPVDTGPARSGATASMGHLVGGVKPLAAKPDSGGSRDYSAAKSLRIRPRSVRHISIRRCAAGSGNISFQVSRSSLIATISLPRTTRTSLSGSMLSNRG